MNFCSNCGTKLCEGMLFCPECGMQLKTTEDAQLHAKIEAMIEQEVAERLEEELAENEKTDRRQSRWIKIALGAVAAVCLLLFAFGGNIFTNHFSEDTEAIESASASVVKLYCLDEEDALCATGSGFAVFDDGIFLTNYHVIESDAYRVIAETDDGYAFEMDYVVAYNQALDIAILQTNEYTGMKCLTTGDPFHLSRGEALVAIGSPLGVRNTVSTGVFSSYVVESDVEMLQFTASISSGSSGGALFNDKGEVIGITTASYVDGQNMNLAVPIVFAEELWAERNSTERLSVVEHGMETELLHAAD